MATDRTARPTRVFDFDPDVPLWLATRTIIAALDDEGLALWPRGGSADDVRAFWVGGRKLVVVPTSRIGPR